MEQTEVRKGQTVRTNLVLGDTKGMNVRRECLEARRPGTIGVLQDALAGYSNEVWWVKHGDKIAAYHIDEFYPAE